MIKHIILFLLASPILMASDLTPEVQKVTLKENYKPHIGILSGLTEPEGELDASGSVMIETALQPVIPFSAGLQFMLSEMDGETESKVERFGLLASASYNFGGDTPIIRHSYLMLSSGAILDKLDGDDQFALGIMPAAGFDHPIKAWSDSEMTLGLRASYLFVTDSRPDELALRAAVKYWY